MNLAKTILLALTITSSFAMAGERIEVSDDMIASVDGRAQVVTVKGPEEFNQVRATILLPQTDNGNPEITLIGTKGVNNYFIESNNSLPLILEKDNSYDASSISANGAKSLIIHMQSSMGRTRSSTELTIAYRNNQFILAGFKRSTHDTVDESASESCEYNLLSGKGVKKGKEVRVRTEVIPFTTLKETEKIYSCEGW